MLLIRLLSVALLSVAATHARADFSALGALETSGARVTALVIDLETGKPIESRNADTRLSPASVTKLVTAAAALETWPADRVFLTRVSSTGAINAQGVLNGDLILHTEGDSTLDHSALWSLAAQIRAVGVRRVMGEIKVSTAPFGPLGCETKDRCDALEKSSTAYNAPLAAIGSDYGNWCIDIKPVTVGTPATITGCGGMALPITIEGSVRTVAGNGRTTYWADRFTVAGADVLRVGGDLAQGAPQSIYRAMSNPPLGVGLLLRETLKVVGIEVVSSPRVVATPAPASATEIARVDGLMLKEQLGRMLRFSNNYIADSLTLNVGAEVNGRAGPLVDGARALSAYMQRVAPQVLPAPLFSGSGLTPENRISAAELATMLASVYRDPVRFPALYGGMVVPRQAPFAFLRQGNKDWMERVALKTGTMNEPVSVCGVAGYLRKKDGGWMSFAILVNGGPGYKRVPLYKSMEAIRKDIEAILERH